MQIIFQDPYSSLNPRKKVGEIIGEGFIIHKLYSKKERTEKVKHLMEVVGLLPDQINRYPHEFSGGQRQRICVARALSIQPKFVIADEPVSALDVSIQAQVLNLLVNLQQEYHLTYLFISHNLSVVKHISDRVAVMYLGHIVEVANRRSLFSGAGDQSGLKTNENHFKRRRSKPIKSATWLHVSHTMSISKKNLQGNRSISHRNRKRTFGGVSFPVRKGGISSG
jgi:ABC-type oligopeptide transport system ATPase subunit